MLVELLKMTGPAITTLFASLEPEGPAFFPVAWAGEGSSRSWFDLGREYTERWHHQQQIRLAVGAPLLNEPRWLRPVIDLSVRALPHRYARRRPARERRVAAGDPGASGGTWSLVREGAAWGLFAGTVAKPRRSRGSPSTKTPPGASSSRPCPDGGPPPAIVLRRPPRPGSGLPDRLGGHGLN